jgi:tight adherence protein B
VIKAPLAVWITAGVIFLAVALAMVAISMTWEWLRERRRRGEAVAQLQKLTTETLVTTGGPSSILREPEAAQSSWMIGLTARLPHLVDIQSLLQQAALSWTPQTYLFRGAGFGLGLALAAMLVSGKLIVVGPAAVLGALLPYFYVRGRIKKRLSAFEERLPDAIDLMGRAIRAGHPLSSGLKMVADEAGEPVAGEFRRVFEEQRFGMSFDDTMLGLADRVPTVDTRILVTAILIQREVGGNLAEVLDKISYVMRERFQIRRQLRTYTAQGRMSGYVLGGLPIAIGGVLFVINPDYMMTLVREPLGNLLLWAAAVMQVSGYLWIRKIVNIEI